MVELQNAIADASGLPPKDVKCFLEALRDVAAKNLRETNVFKLHNVVLMRMRRIPARTAVAKLMFGKIMVCLHDGWPKFMVCQNEQLAKISGWSELMVG